jgi:hypothetical protein
VSDADPPAPADTTSVRDADPPAPEDTTSVRDADPPAPADATANAPDSSSGFQSIEVEAADRCPYARSGIAFSSPSKVLVTTGCGFYAVDIAHGNSVEQLDSRGDTIDDDGETIAVITDRLGLSTDGGSTFAWTDWSLGRCQGTPLLSTGDRFAAIACVAGLGRWRGQGSAFETLTPSHAAAPLLPVAAASGSRLVIAESDGWFISKDGGDSFDRFTVDGLPESFQRTALESVDSRLFVPVPLGDGSSPAPTALFATAADSGHFTRVAAFPAVMGMLALSYHDGVLVVTNGARLLVSADGGDSFLEVATGGAVALGAVARYAAQHLFVMANGTLYVSRFVPPR